MGQRGVSAIGHAHAVAERDDKGLLWEKMAS
jgi:hypothetical protein